MDVEKLAVPQKNLKHSYNRPKSPRNSISVPFKKGSRLNRGNTAPEGLMSFSQKATPPSIEFGNRSLVDCQHIRPHSGHDR
ncbi:hypothetical protein CDAR_589481 [Caerostris darwini]|uniref:Uncharacterized protein n=1 Tax=Caerostris darwini TaxID=1538125 RepID=A0AAV4TXT3_9ARAC|nr:hypothetical protein CDAR_589481 [Caerostris darwini]